MKLSQSGEMTEILVPLYHKRKVQVGKYLAQKEISIIFNWYIVFLSVIVIVIILFRHKIAHILMPGFTDSDRLLGADMIYKLILLVPIIFCNGQLQAMINAERKYGIVELISVLSRIFIIFTIVFFYKIGIWIMVYSLWIGTIIKFLFLLIIYYRMGNRHYLKFKSDNNQLLPILKRLWSTIPYIFGTQLWLVIFNAGLTTLPQGTLAVFTYVRNIAAKIEAVLLRPISIVFFNNFSDSHASQSRNLDKLIDKSTELILLIGVPIVTISLTYGHQILSVLWLNDNYPKNLIHLSSIILSILLGLFVVSGISVIGRKIIMVQEYVMESYALLFFSQVITAIFAYVAIKSWGLNGAIITIIVNKLLLASVPFIIMRIKNKAQLFFYNWYSLLKWAVILFIISMFSHFINSNIFYTTADDLTSNRIYSLILGISVSSIVIILLAYMMRIRIITELFEKLKSL